MLIRLDSNLALVSWKATNTSNMRADQDRIIIVIWSVHGIVLSILLLSFSEYVFSCPVLVYHFTAQLRLCFFLLPPPPNFAKTHTRLGRGRLGVGCRDLIPPWGYTRCAGAAFRGSGLCRVGVLPGPGWVCPGGVLAGAGVFSRAAARKTFFKKALRACIRKPSTRFRQDWWIRLSSGRFFGGFSRCYFRRKE